jgi:hypothetical protein
VFIRAGPSKTLDPLQREPMLNEGTALVFRRLDGVKPVQTFASRKAGVD